jgi:hypothetical protein
MKFISQQSLGNVLTKYKTITWHEKIFELLNAFYRHQVNYLA